MWAWWWEWKSTPLHSSLVPGRGGERGGGADFARVVIGLSSDSGAKLWCTCHWERANRSRRLQEDGKVNHDKQGPFSEGRLVLCDRLRSAFKGLRRPDGTTGILGKYNLARQMEGFPQWNGGKTRKAIGWTCFLSHSRRPIGFVTSWLNR